MQQQEARRSTMGVPLCRALFVCAGERTDAVRVLVASFLLAQWRGSKVDVVNK